MEGIQLTVEEVVEYFQKAYPKEFEITVLTLQNQKLIEKIQEQENLVAQSLETPENPL